MLIRDCVHSGLCPFGIVYFRNGVHSGLYPFGIVSIRDCAHSGLCPFGIVSIQDGAHSGWCPFGQLSVYPIFPANTKCMYTRNFLRCKYCLICLIDRLLICLLSLIKAEIHSTSFHSFLRAY